MKKTLPLLVVGILVLSGLGAIALSNDDEEIIQSETIIFSQPILIENDDYYEIELSESTSFTSGFGNPALPVVTKQYIFPFGTEITQVDVEYETFSQQKISKPIKPAPEPQIVGLENVLIKIKEKISLHSQLMTYPETPYSYGAGSGLENGEHVVFLAVHLHPVKYNSLTKTVLHSEKATINIQYILPEQPATFGDTYDLLILTPDKYANTLQTLVDHKNDIGIPTTLVTLDEIPSVGLDEQEDIKYYIKDAIENWGISSVILVGSGIEGLEEFPVRNAWIPSGSYEQYFPSDLYYADVYDAVGGFSSWDHDGDGKHCEIPADIPAVDLYPDVYLTRFPCNDETELQTVIDKIILYKEHNKMLNNIVQLGGDTFPGDAENIYEGEYANEAVLSKLPGYTSTKLWGSLGTLTKTKVIMGINNNVDFLDCSGHGSWASWATHPPEDDTKWIPKKTVYSPNNGFMYYDADYLLNAHKFPVMVFNACSCSKFSENPNCISWTMLAREGGGAIATFGASGIGYGSHGTDEIERLWGWCEVHLFEELYNTKLLGGVWANVLNNYINSFELDDGDYKTITEMAMFGDPTLRIEDGDDPQNQQSQSTSLQSILLNQQSTQFNSQQTSTKLSLSLISQMINQMN